VLVKGATVGNIRGKWYGDPEPVTDKAVSPAFCRSQLFVRKNSSPPRCRSTRRTPSLNPKSPWLPAQSTALFCQNTQHRLYSSLPFTPSFAMLSFLALSSLLFPLIAAVPCVQFDTSFNLYAFGGSQDVNLGQSSSWACECTVRPCGIDADAQLPMSSHSLLRADHHGLVTTHSVCSASTTTPCTSWAVIPATPL